MPQPIERKRMLLANKMKSRGIRLLDALEKERGLSESTLARARNLRDAIVAHLNPDEFELHEYEQDVPD